MTNITEKGWVYGRVSKEQKLMQNFAYICFRISQTFSENKFCLRKQRRNKLKINWLLVLFSQQFFSQSILMQNLAKIANWNAKNAKFSRNIFSNSTGNPSFWSSVFLIVIIHSKNYAQNVFKKKVFDSILGWLTIFSTGEVGFN